MHHIDKNKYEGWIQISLDTAVVFFQHLNLFEHISINNTNITQNDLFFNKSLVSKADMFKPAVSSAIF